MIVDRILTALKEVVNVMMDTKIAMQALDAKPLLKKISSIVDHVDMFVDLILHVLEESVNVLLDTTIAT